MTLGTLFRSSESRPRAQRHKDFHHYHPVLEGMEERTVMSHMSVTALAAQVHHAHAQQSTVGNIAKHATALHLTGVQVSSVTLVPPTTDQLVSNTVQLVANAVISGTVKKHAFNIPAQIPITLSAVPSASTTSTAGTVTAAAAPAVSVLNLSLGAINLSLLGLNVHLGGTCTYGDTTPITAAITAIPTGTTYQGYQGGLLGDVLSGVANLLNGSTGLGGLLGSPALNDPTGLLGTGGTLLSQVESGLTQVLNQILHPASGATGGTFGGTTATGGTTTLAAAPAGSTEVLELPLGPINLDLLGALVQTSHICLNLTATPGPGNLLGNLLG